MRKLEAKFEIRDPSAAQIAAIAIGYKPAGLITQNDTHFAARAGKLKLREEDERSYLVGYRRVERAGLQLSEYQILPVHDAAGMRRLLSESLGLIGEVRKRRTLLVREHLRLHLDEVDGLGFFGEIEAILDDDSDLDDDRRAVERTLRALKIEAGKLVDDSYFELLQRKRAPGALP